MGSPSTSSVKSFDALERRDPTLAELVVKSDKQIDNLEREIEDQVISMIARRQPMADDLRHVIAALRITGDLERIGDLAKNIAKRALAIAHESHPKPLMSGLRHMGELALEQLKDVLDAYVERDPIARSPCGARTRKSTPCTIRCSASS